MFELMYLQRAIAFAEKYPRETVAGLVVIVVSSQITNMKAQKAKAEAAKIERECELIRLETAKVEAKNRNA